MTFTIYELAQNQWDDEEGSANLVDHFQTSNPKTEAEKIVSGLVANLDRHATIVDLGCGPGRYVDALPAFRTYKGYDTSEHLLSAARDVNKGRKGVRFINRDILDGADYKRPVDVALSIDTSRHYHDPLPMLDAIIERWPAVAYVFSILHGPEDTQLINGRCLATADVDAWMAKKNITTQTDQPISGGMSVRYFVLEFGS